MDANAIHEAALEAVDLLEEANRHLSDAESRVEECPDAEDRRLIRNQIDLIEDSLRALKMKLEGTSK